MVSLRDDLLDAEAPINWAKAQLLILQNRVASWNSTQPYSVVTDLRPETGKKYFKLAHVKPLDPLINAEVGVIINSLRSSLDLVTASVAKRSGYTGKKIYFPIAASAAQFASGKGYKGSEAIRALPARERAIIENLEPWHGGNRDLVAMHELDILRKHRRLIDVKFDPSGVIVSPDTYAAGFEMTPVWQGLKNDAIIGSMPINAPKCNVHITLHIKFDEAVSPSTSSLLPALYNFAGLAESIIELFD